ncbi:MAG TPA: hypothetical protein VG733_20055 [Chthoniobacteraceae bacterium]|nr:hypothetical protein [Chthoniobacteraceae bacterium]
MKKYKRVTAFIQDEENLLSREGRLVEEADLPAIDRVFKMFDIAYEVDEIPAGERLYSLTVAMEDRFITDNLLTKKELAEHVSPYLGKKGLISNDEFKKLLSGRVSQIHKSAPGGELLLGYEFTIKNDGKRSIFSFARFRRKKPAAKPD